MAFQQDALTRAGCERLFTDTASGSYVVRPGLDEVLGFVRPGDTLVVWRLGLDGPPEAASLVRQEGRAQDDECPAWRGTAWSLP